MKRTESRLARAALTASLLAATGAAHAVPIVFDFVGTASGTRISEHGHTSFDDSLAGQSVIGRITIESEGLVFNSSASAQGTTQGYTDAMMDPTELIVSELSIGGVSYDVGLYSGDIGAISAFDSSGVPSCGLCAPFTDRIAVGDSSTDYGYRDGVDAPPPGEYYRRTLTLSWSDDNDPTGFIDLSGGLEALDVVAWLTGRLPGASYSELAMDCADGNCLTTRSSFTDFSISSLTISTPSVPEPGTLALFAVGLLGTGLARRRKLG